MKSLVFALASAASLFAAQAIASPCTTTIMLPTVDGSEPFASLSLPGVCVQAQDELFSNFNFGTLPISIGTVTFALQNFSGQDNYDITFTDALAASTTYTFSYDVAATNPTGSVSELLADFTQTTGGPSVLTASTTPSGIGSIDLTKTGHFPSGTNEIDYNPSVLNLMVSETISVGANANDSAIENTLVGVDTPEPASLGLLGAALLGFGLTRRQQLRSSRSSAPGRRSKLATQRSA